MAIKRHKTTSNMSEKVADPQNNAKKVQISYS